MGISREDYLKLSDLCPTIDPKKVETFEVVLFFCDFIETKILPFNTYVNWEENHKDKEKILHIIKVTRMYIEKKVTFEKLKECKNLVKNSDECRGLTNLFTISFTYLTKYSQTNLNYLTFNSLIANTNHLQNYHHYFLFYNLMSLNIKFF